MKTVDKIIILALIVVNGGIIFGMFMDTTKTVETTPSIVEPGSIGLEGNFSAIDLNVSYVVAVAGGGGAISSSYEFNSTECNKSSSKLGTNCTCFTCGSWLGYNSRGFYNRSGVYYDDGTPTGMTLKQMSDCEETAANIRYEQDMNSYGHYRVDGKWV